MVLELEPNPDPNFGTRTRNLKIGFFLGKTFGTGGLTASFRPGYSESELSLIFGTRTGARIKLRVSYFCVNKTIPKKN
jgi:hypothetical protein